MEWKLMRIFVSGKLVRSAGANAESRAGAGRPAQHAACIILAMLAVRAEFGIGYRRTCAYFRESGYTKLPDFRTMSWRANKLKRSRIGISVASCDSGEERWMIVHGAGRGKTFVRTARIGKSAGMRLVRGLGEDYVEMAL